MRGQALACAVNGGPGERQRAAMGAPWTAPRWGAGNAICSPGTARPGGRVLGNEQLANIEPTTKAVGDMLGIVALSALALARAIAGSRHGAS